MLVDRGLRLVHGVIVTLGVLLRLVERLVVLAEFLHHGLSEDVVAGHIVLRELIAHHLSEPREHDEEHHERDDGRQTRAQHGVLLLLVKSHLLLLITLLVVAALLRESFELRTHPLHRLRIAAGDDLLPDVEGRKDEFEYDGERDDGPAEHGYVVIQPVHQLGYKVGRLGHAAVRDVEGAAVRVARRKNEYAQNEQCRHCVYLKHLAASVIYTSHLILPL